MTVISPRAPHILYGYKFVPEHAQKLLEFPEEKWQYSHCPFLKISSGNQEDTELLRVILDTVL